MFSVLLLFRAHEEYWKHILLTYSNYIIFFAAKEISHEYTLEIFFQQKP